MKPMMPIRIDLLDGYDGYDINEIIFALNLTADLISSQDKFRSDYMRTLSKKITKVRNRRKKILSIDMDLLHCTKSNKNDPRERVITS